MAAPHTHPSSTELARECDLLTQERDDLQFELAWNEHTITELQERLFAEQQEHTRTDARAVRLWELLKQQTRQLLALRASAGER